MRINGGLAVIIVLTVIIKYPSMKRFSILWFILIQSINGYGQIFSNCSVAPELRDAYEYDIRQ